MNNTLTTPESGTLPSSPSRRSFLLKTGALSIATYTTTSLPRTAQAAPDTAQDIITADAVVLSHWIHHRQVSCQEVMQTFLDHISTVNPTVNAIISLQPSETLLAQAQVYDQQLAQGHSMGWMHGLPLAVKDLAATKGITTSYGSPLFKDWVPAHDAIVVERMKQAGAIVIGKTNTPEFGVGSQTYNTVFGTTRNAYDPTKTAGGSSGGAAVSLALCMQPVADGSDMAGSLRNPAAFNNVYGFRPSSGRVPYGPTGEVFFQQMGYEGPMARNVSDIAHLLSIQAGFDSRTPLSIAQDPKQFQQPLHRSFKGTRIGWLGNFNDYLAMEPGILDLCTASFQHFEAIGCTIEAVQPDFDMQRLWKTWLTLRHWVIAGTLGTFYADTTKRDLLKPEIQWEIENGLKLNGTDLWQASVNRSAWYEALRNLFTRYDYLLLPSAQVFPFEAAIHWPKAIGNRTMDTYHRWMEITVGITLSGCPSINVPVGFSAAGLPMGMQIIGPATSDLAVLQLAHAYDQATQWVRRHPPALLNTRQAAKAPPVQNL